MPSFTIGFYNIGKYHMVTFFILIPTVIITPRSFGIQYQAVRSADLKLSTLNISNGICAGYTGSPGSYHNDPS